MHGKRFSIFSQLTIIFLDYQTLFYYSNLKDRTVVRLLAKLRLHEDTFVQLWSLIIFGIWLYLWIEECVSYEMGRISLVANLSCMDVYASYISNYSTTTAHLLRTSEAYKNNRGDCNKG